MVEGAKRSVSDSTETATRADDLTGRSRIVRNVLTSWAAYFVFIVSGFIMPRFVDGIIGQTSLGIWDFSWSFVSYFSIMDLGIGSSVNRHVALYRTQGEIEKLSQLVSSVFLFQLLIGSCVLVMSFLCMWILPIYFQARLGDSLGVAQWVVGLLGASMAIEMMLNTSRGVITGCHRWDLHNGINAASKAVATVGMMVALLMGGGLIGMGAVYLVSVIGVESYRKMMSLRVCPGLKIRFSNVRWIETKEVLRFGVKTIVSDMPPLLFVQSSSLLLAWALGPAMLAVFSRPLALIRHVQTLVNKFAFVIVPTAGSLHGSNNREELRKFMIQMTRYGVIITAPLLVTLGVFGDVVLQFWMGDRYANGNLVMVLAIGYFLPVAQNSVLRVLVGMNAHGRPGLMCLVLGSVVFVSGTIVMMMTEWSLMGIAIVLGLALTVGGGVVVPVQVCRLLEVPLSYYVNRVFVGPLFCNVVYGSILVAVRHVGSAQPVASFVVGTSLGGLVLVCLYWRFLFSEEARSRVRGLLMSRIGRTK